jgi:2-amino-4-hydroxy-6-hydroxymethyldihydropteridine diphosphokinase
MGPIEQPDFINAAAGLVTRLGPAELLAALLALERALGRERGGQRWGPRRIDLDLLLYGNLTLREEALELPHPGISERSFVLYPLCELAPELWVPGRGRVTDLAAALGSSGLERIA